MLTSSAFRVGLKFALFGGETLLAANYYECTHCQDHSPLYANSANGNTTYSWERARRPCCCTATTSSSSAARWASPPVDLPLTIWANYAQNMAEDVEFDTAYGAGVMLGKASNPRTWEAGVFYQSIDKDALFGQLSIRTSATAATDSEGWVFKGALRAGPELHGGRHVFPEHAATRMSALELDLRPAAAGPQLQVLRCGPRYSRSAWPSRRTGRGMQTHLSSSSDVRCSGECVAPRTCRLRLPCRRRSPAVQRIVPETHDGNRRSLASHPDAATTRTSRRPHQVLQMGGMVEQQLRTASRRSSMATAISARRWRAMTTRSMRWKWRSTTIAAASSRRAARRPRTCA